MPEDTATDPAPNRTWVRITAYIVALAALIVATVLACFLGLFLGYGAIDSTRPQWVLALILGVGTIGTAAIGVVCAIWGGVSLARGEDGWGVPAIGVVAVWLNFAIASALISI